MHHTEPGEITVREIARIRISACIQEVRPKFDHSKRSSYSGEVVPTILCPRATQLVQTHDYLDVNLQDVNILRVISICTLR